MPKADAEEPRAAPLVLLGLLPLAVLVPVPVEVTVALAGLEELPLVAELDPDPLSLTAVLRQLVLVPAMIVA